MIGEQGFGDFILHAATEVREIFDYEDKGMKLVPGVSLGVIVEPGDTDERSGKVVEAPRVNDFGGVLNHMKEIGKRFGVIAPFTLNQGEAEAGL